MYHHICGKEIYRRVYHLSLIHILLGPSGSGKSFFTNHLVRQYYEQGAHVLLVDTGNSYLGLSQLILNRTNGEDGIYFTYTN